MQYVFMFRFNFSLHLFNHINHYGVEKMCVLVDQITSSDLIIIVWCLNSILVRFQKHIFMFNVWNSITQKKKKPKTKHKKKANKQPIQALYKGYAFSSHFKCKTYTFFLLKIKALDFGELIFINSPMQSLWQNESETVFGSKHKSSPLTSLGSWI